jgi:methyltransferase (TIGR00027 family)
MRRKQSSRTAIGIAIVRALESERPENERICYDPFARRFSNEPLFRLVRGLDRLRYTEWMGPGVIGYLVVRERHIDEYLKNQLHQGMEQLVILGAGLDARAYRIEELQHGIRIFEVDHPASQAAKLAKLRSIFGTLPAHVNYVAVDFNTQTLEDRLPAAGYASNLKTLFVWQGVTQYLTPAAVDSTLAFIASHSAVGSSVIFDYMYPTLLDGTIKRGDVSRIRREGWTTGEPLIFRIREGTVKEFLEQRGFADVQDVDTKSLHELYFHGASEKRTVAYGYAIASAVVPASQGHVPP